MKIQDKSRKPNQIILSVRSCIITFLLLFLSISHVQAIRIGISPSSITADTNSYKNQNKSFTFYNKNKFDLEVNIMTAAFKQSKNGIVSKKFIPWEDTNEIKILSKKKFILTANKSSLIKLRIKYKNKPFKVHFFVITQNKNSRHKVPMGNRRTMVTYRTGLGVIIKTNNYLKESLNISNKKNKSSLKINDCSIAFNKNKPSFRCLLKTNNQIFINNITIQGSLISKNNRYSKPTALHFFPKYNYDKFLKSNKVEAFTLMGPIQLNIYAKIPKLIKKGNYKLQFSIKHKKNIFLTLHQNIKLTAANAQQLSKIYDWSSLKLGSFIFAPQDSLIFSKKRRSINLKIKNPTTKNITVHFKCAQQPNCPYKFRRGKFSIRATKTKIEQIKLQWSSLLPKHKKMAPKILVLITQGTKEHRFTLQPTIKILSASISDHLIAVHHSATQIPLTP